MPPRKTYQQARAGMCLLTCSVSTAGSGPVQPGRYPSSLRAHASVLHSSTLHSGAIRIGGWRCVRPWRSQCSGRCSRRASETPRSNTPTSPHCSWCTSSSAAPACYGPAVRIGNTFTRTSHVIDRAAMRKILHVESLCSGWCTNRDMGDCMALSTSSSDEHYLSQGHVCM